jgi:hypothetical protein
MAEDSLRAVCLPRIVKGTLEKEGQNIIYFSNCQALFSFTSFKNTKLSHNKSTPPPAQDYFYRLKKK